jgi:large subunit ribosomal protein L7Ae
MSDYIKFSVSDDLRTLQDETLKKIAKSGKIKIGINEVTKAIERNTAKLVVIAEDVTPVEIVMHIPVIAKEKNIPYTYVKTKDELGKAVGISAKASCIAVMDAGVNSKELQSLVGKIQEITGHKEAPKAEHKAAEHKAPVEHKAAEHKEAPKAEHKSKPKVEEPKVEEPKAEEAKEDKE